MVTAVECINQACWILTFLRRLLQDLNQNFTNNGQKQSVNIRDETGRRINVAWDLLRSDFHEPQKNEIHFLNEEFNL